jgi:hypothetical protein
MLFVHGKKFLWDLMPLDEKREAMGKHCLFLSESLLSCQCFFHGLWYDGDAHGRRYGDKK